MCIWKRKTVGGSDGRGRGGDGAKKDDRFSEIDRSLDRDTAIGRRKRYLIAAILVVLAVVIVFHKNFRPQSASAASGSVHMMALTVASPAHVG